MFWHLKSAVLAQEALEVLQVALRRTGYAKSPRSAGYQTSTGKMMGPLSVRTAVIKEDRDKWKVGQYV